MSEPATPMMESDATPSPGPAKPPFDAITSLLSRARPADAAGAAQLDALVRELLRAGGPDAPLRVARALADAAWPTPGLLFELAEADPRAAQLLAASPVLDAEARARLAGLEGEAGELALAARPGLPAHAAERLADSDHPAVRLALVLNAAAVLPPAAVERLVTAAGEEPALRAPLVRRPELTAEAAARLEPDLAEADRAELQARFGPRRPPAPPRSPDVVREAAERRLVDKLVASGRLRPGFLLRTLREERLSLFHAALAALGGFDVAAVEHAARTDPAGLACALRAVGVDRSAFPTFLALVRALDGGRPRDRAGAPDAVAQAFRLPPGEAVAQVRAAGARG